MSLSNWTCLVGSTHEYCFFQVRSDSILFITYAQAKVPRCNINFSFHHSVLVFQNTFFLSNTCWNINIILSERSTDSIQEKTHIFSHAGGNRIYWDNGQIRGWSCHDSICGIRLRLCRVPVITVPCQRNHDLWSHCVRSWLAKTRFTVGTLDGGDPVSCWLIVTLNLNHQIIPI